MELIEGAVLSFFPRKSPEHKAVLIKALRQTFKEDPEIYNDLSLLFKETKSVDRLGG